MRKSVLFLALISGISVVLLPLFSFAQVTNGVQKLAAFKKQQQMLQQSPYKDLSWRLVGPDNKSGRCTDVVGVTGRGDRCGRC